MFPAWGPAESGPGASLLLGSALDVSLFYPFSPADLRHLSVIDGKKTKFHVFSPDLVYS